MQITYTSTNIAHHYRYARELQRLGCLKAFVTGVSRLSPRGGGEEFGDKFIRRDFFQNLYLASLRGKLPDGVSNTLARLSNRRLDSAAFEPARESDVFLYYRTTGYGTTKRLHAMAADTLCVMEEVNSHVDNCHELMKNEYEKLGRGPYRGRFSDHALRLKTYEEADCILCPSGFVKRSFLERGFSEDRLLMVNFGFTLPMSSVQKKQEDDVFRLLYVGQLHFRKGLRYAVEAFKKLPHPKKEFLIVGPTTKVSGLEGVSLPGEVKIAGVLKGEDLAAAYASASVFVLPTIEEGLALVLGEAMAAGLPVITTSHSGGDDIITDGIEGFIVPPCDTKALEEAFQKLADDRGLCQSMGEAAHARAKELGDWSVSAQKLVDGLQRVCDRKKARV